MNLSNLYREGSLKMNPEFIDRMIIRSSTLNAFFDNYSVNNSPHYPIHSIYRKHNNEYRCMFSSDWISNIIDPTNVHRAENFYLNPLKEPPKPKKCNELDIINRFLSTREEL